MPCANTSSRLGQVEELTLQPQRGSSRNDVDAAHTAAYHDPYSSARVTLHIILASISIAGPLLSSLPAEPHEMD
jgi:hypothetical protein